MKDSNLRYGDMGKGKNSDIQIENSKTTNLSRIHLHSSTDINNIMQNILRPRFLGSIHLKRNTNNGHVNPVENLLKGELELKINNSIRNSFINPFTKFLILLTIIFNVFWFLSMVF